MAKNYWAKDEIIVALYLYFIVPFQRVNKSHPIIQQYAKILGRTPSALGMKIGNLGRFDQTLRIQNISGLSNGSKMDGEVWNEFAGKWELLEQTYKKIIQQKISETSDTPIIPHYNIPEGKEYITQISARMNQSFFRAVILASYNSRCCITGIDIPELLVASHIKPWKDDVENRLNPQNGLCLNALHDKAFDRGLFTLDDNFNIILSSKLKQSKQTSTFFKLYENQKIALPDRLSPDLVFLKYHRENIFKE